MAKRVLIVAGPNGAGKTTYAREVLAFDRELEFANADEIAARLRPDDPSAVAHEAGRRLLDLIESLVAADRSFLLETTLSGRTYATRIHEWRAAGYEVGLTFLSLASPDQAVERVRARIRHGGHAVPEEDIRRRFFSGVANFRNLYAPIVDRWQFFDCSSGMRILKEEWQ